MKLYIETSVPNMLFHDDAPDKQQVTAVFFPWLQICQDVDVVVSWNMKHLVNPRRVAQVNEVAARHGYDPIRAQTPREVMGI